MLEDFDNKKIPDFKDDDTEMENVFVQSIDFDDG